MTKNLTAIDRFWKGIVKSSTGCWNKGTGKGRGYSYFWNGVKSVRSTRFIWEYENGPIPKGMYVLHNCDNPPCIRIEHLHLGDQRQNMGECKQRGRIASVHGDRNPNARLTPAQVLKIRVCLARGEFQYVIARKFKVSEITINRINRGVAWSA